MEVAAVEVEIGGPGDAFEGAFVPDFHPVQQEGIVTQFDGQCPQSKVHFEEFFAEGDGAVFAHDAFGAGVKERVDFLRLLDLPQGMAPPLKQACGLMPVEPWGRRW